MKNLTKILCLTLSLIMALSLCTTAFAATEPQDIQMKVDGSGTYKAYQLLKLTYQDDAEEGKGYAYAMNPTFAAVWSNEHVGLTDQTPNGIQTFFAGKNTDASMRELANALMDAINGQTFADSVYDLTGGTPITVKQGYYLITETAVSGTNDEKSLVLLNTADKVDSTGSVVVTAKEGVPTVTKQVKTNGGFVDSVMAGVGKTVTYQLTGTLSSYASGYKTYSYKFVDNMSKGLSFNSDSVTAKYIDGAGNESALTSDKFQVSTKGGASDENGTKIGILFTGVQAYADVDAGAAGQSKIVIEYTATVTTDAAKVSDNTVKVQYSNDPRNTDDYTDPDPDNPGPGGETPEANAKVYKMDLNVTSYHDTPEAGNELEGSKVRMWKQNESGEWAPVKINGTVGDVGEETGEVNDTAIDFNRLDDGVYMIIETDRKDGYNQAADVIFKVETQTTTTEDETSKETSITGITISKVKDRVDTFTTDLTNLPALSNPEWETVTDFIGTSTVPTEEMLLSVSLVHTTGQLLPSTGGAGTTMLYVGGIATLIAAAGVLILFTRKRKSIEE